MKELSLQEINAFADIIDRLSTDNQILRKQLAAEHARLETLLAAPSIRMTTPLGLLPCDSIGMRQLLDYTLSLKQELKDLKNTISISTPAEMSTPLGPLPINSEGMRRITDYAAYLKSKIKAIQSILTL